MSLNRRQFVAGAGAAVGMAGLGTTVLANEVVSIEIVEMNPTEETVVLKNTGDEAVDLEGYQIDWEHEDDQDQTDTIDDSLVLEPGEQVSIWSGFQSTQIDNVQADYQIADHGNGRINDDDPDVIALLSPESEVVATSDGYSAGEDNSSDDGSDSDSDNDTDENADENDDTDGDSEADEDDDDTDSGTDEDGDNGESTVESDEGDANEETEEPVEEDCPEEEADVEAEAKEEDCPEEEDAAVETEADADEDC